MPILTDVNMSIKSTTHSNKVCQGLDLRWGFATSPQCCGTTNTPRHEGARHLSVSLLSPTSLLHIDSFPKGTPFEEGAGADESKFSKAVKAADKLGERIAKTTDKIMEMRQDIDGKQVQPLLCSIQEVDVEDDYKKQRRSLVQHRHETFTEKFQTYALERHYWAYSD